LSLSGSQDDAIPAADSASPRIDSPSAGVHGKDNHQDERANTRILGRITLILVIPRHFSMAVFALSRDSGLDKVEEQQQQDNNKWYSKQPHNKPWYHAISPYAETVWFNGQYLMKPLCNILANYDFQWRIRAIGH
jgi:hypothetical protein